MTYSVFFTEKIKKTRMSQSTISQQILKISIEGVYKSPQGFRLLVSEGLAQHLQLKKKNIGRVRLLILIKGWPYNVDDDLARELIPTVKKYCSDKI